MTLTVLSMSKKPEDTSSSGGKGLGKGEVKGHRKKGGTFLEEGMELGWGNNKRQTTQDSEGLFQDTHVGLIRAAATVSLHVWVDWKVDLKPLNFLLNTLPKSSSLFFFLLGTFKDLN